MPQSPLCSVVRVMSLPDYHLEDQALDPNGVSYVEPHETKIVKPCVKVRMKCGATLICAGTPNDFVGLTLETLSQRKMPETSNKDEG